MTPPSEGAGSASSKGLATLFAVSVIYASLHLNRQLFAVLSESLRREFALSDVSLGMLGSTTFSFVYALLGLHFGELADRQDRSRFVVWGAWIWSISCAAAALAPGFSWLVASRGAVAFGEAMASAAAVALVAQLASERFRAGALSLFVAFAFVGSGSAAVLGGLVMEAVGSSYGWRAAMVMASVPGAAGAVSLTLLRQGVLQIPRKRAQGLGTSSWLALGALLVVIIQMNTAPSWSVPLTAVVALTAATMWFRIISRHDPGLLFETLGVARFRWLLGAFAVVVFVDFAASFWLIPYAQRRFSTFGSNRIAIELGLLLVVFGIVGCLIGGVIADRWRRAWAQGRILTAMCAVAIEGVSITVAVQAHGYFGFLCAFGCFCAASGAWATLVAAVGFDIIGPRRWSMAAAQYYFVTSLCGAGFGPFLVGAVSDHLHSLGPALIYCSFGMLIALIALGKVALLSPPAKDTAPTSQ